MKKTNTKYGLSEIEIGKSKLFPIAIYDKIRLAAHFTGKRHGWKFSTKKLDKTVRVTRIS